ncbi:acetyl-CoA carboxylase carboxyltransferase subunit beta [Pseudoflavonifractor sp. DSM 107456]|uniref:Acetyl-coenzyme A carboxylase carboxyl transferase subunit beta n=3 Tax=Clostridia TaxID=186801 RepID=A0ABR9R7J5_9FIRM|nr:acetyl-CoA carboxylase carboxyltransferase subunit beta [Pseudoflavonifractor hominis]MBE5054662.1 acetyl-CoA carboxylase carboxyltransferase subunit beta [Pseudoflavonifractor gallinarum]MBS5134262.1 acetyl-CoA carboxylase carboxyltransferase subunit beta [Oscillospiraceae bacterium]MBT9685635.1 acetyl-CoA carboxylase carboxyltransferase subunit beta [Pseudoflavonifractor sp. MCC625]
MQLQQQRGLREKAAVKRPEAAVFEKCPACGAAISKRDLVRALYVCPQCGHHHKIGAYLRLSMLLDPHTFQELDERFSMPNVLNFPGYDEKLAQLRRTTGLTEGVVTAKGKVNGRPIIAAVLDSQFLMGSMGVAVGEKITRAVELARKQRLPLVIFSASGGARMQEGILSLMQMAKTSAALEKFSQSGGLYISVFTHPTTGGVTASFASLGDYTLAEPGALIGFAGPRVIEQTIGQKLPEGFQRAEYLEEHGFVDQIVPRAQMRETISLLLTLHEKGGKLRD